MDRRTVLRCAAVRRLSGSTGCVGEFTPISNTPTVTGIETGYPELSRVTYDVGARPVEADEDEPFEVLLE